MKIRAAVLVKSNAPLELEELEIAPLRFGQVLVKIHYSGICGAQINEIDATKGSDKFLPHLLGHEGCGTVLDAGEGVKHVQRGDKVVMHWRQGAGLQSEPPVYTSQGRRVNAGWVTTFQDYAIVSENRLTTIPADFDSRLAPLFGCAITTAFGVVNNDARVKVGESVIVFGAGGVGLAIIKALSMVSAYPIVAVDINMNKRVAARAAGATSAITPKIAQDLKKADVVIETTGVKEIIELAYALTHPDGRTVLVGVPREKVSIYTLPIHFKQTLHGSHGGSAEPHLDIPRYIRLMAAGKFSLDGMVTHEFPLAEINDAISLVRSGDAGRVMVRME